MIRHHRNHFRVLYLARQARSISWEQVELRNIALSAYNNTTFLVNGAEVKATQRRYRAGHDALATILGVEPGSLVITTDLEDHEKQSG